MTRGVKLLAKMRRNPRDWRIEDLVAVAAQRGIQVRNDGGSHHVFFAPAIAKRVSVPARRPIKPVYVRLFLALLDEVLAMENSK